MQPDYTKIDVVARCLALQDDRFISATDWHGAVGAQYRGKATKVLQAIDKYNNGERSGGLPIMEYDSP